MKQTVDFLTALAANNDRVWFEAHREQYRAVLEEYVGFVGELIGAIASFDDSVANLTARDCIFRIYRDVRFSRDKSPYKRHLGAYIARGGRNGEWAGYYFHVEPAGGSWLGGSFLTAGLWRPQPAVLSSVRDEVFDNGSEVESAIAAATGFELDNEENLLRTPQGYPAGTAYDYLLRHRNFSVSKSVDNDYLTADSLVERVADDFSRTARFVKLLNRSVDFARENR